MALDYSWGCKNGVAECFNTHGSLEFDDWTVVHDQSNCDGTVKGDCSVIGSGAGQPNMTRIPGMQIVGGNALASSSQTRLSPIYDYVIKVANNGSVHYFGAVVDGEQEVTIPIDGSLYSALTGQPDVYSIDGIFRFYPGKLFGQQLADYNKQLAFSFGLGKQATADILKLIGEREIMLQFLNAAQVPVADQNNLLEIMFKYVYHNPIFKGYLNDHDYSLAIGAHTVNRKSNMAMDWGALASGVVNTIVTITQAFESEEDFRQLVVHLNAHREYMRVDFADIEREAREKGPEAGLEWLLRLKRTSWKDLKTYILNWLAERGISIPDELTALWDAQLTIEQALRDDIQAGGNSSTLPLPVNNAPFSPGGSTGNVNTGGGTKPVAMDIEKLLPWGIGLAVLFLFLKK